MKANGLTRNAHERHALHLRTPGCALSGGAEKENQDRFHRGFKNPSPPFSPLVREVIVVGLVIVDWKLEAVEY